MWERNLESLWSWPGKKKSRQFILMKIHIKHTVNNKHMSSLWSRSSGKWRLIAFRVVSIWARCTKLGNSIFVQETKKSCLSIKMWQWAISERGTLFFFLFPHPWNDDMKWRCPMRQRALQAVSDHLFLAPDVTAASLRRALLRHTAETAQVDESIRVVCLSSVLEDNEHILNSSCSYRSVLSEETNGQSWCDILTGLFKSLKWSLVPELSVYQPNLLLTKTNNDIRSFSWPQSGVLPINAYRYII